MAVSTLSSKVSSYCDLSLSSGESAVICKDMVLIDVHVMNYSITKIKTTNAQFIKLADRKLNTPPIRVMFPIQIKSLKDPLMCKGIIKVLNEHFNVDRFISSYLSPLVLSFAIDLTAGAGGKEMDTKGKGFTVKGVLDVYSEEVVDKSSVFGGDGGFTCAVCLEELSDGSEYCTQTPCNHIFHCDCLVPWLVKNRTCPICRRIVGDHS